VSNSPVNHSQRSRPGKPGGPVGLTSRPRLAARDDALSWLEAERASLVAAPAMAAAADSDRAGLRLPLVLAQ
jgi:hypothetical protein